MNIVVLAGGISTEREISIISGTKVCKALREKEHRAIVVDVSFGKEEMPSDLFPSAYDLDREVAYINSFNGQAENRKKDKEFFGSNVLEICRQADIVFLALHGENGENGKVQACFDLMGIKYTGTGPLGSGMAMDKGITKSIFRSAGVPTPGGVLLKKDNYSKKLEDYQMKLPVVVKPCCGGSSVGVCIAKSQEEYEKALEESFSYEEETIVEEYIQGREFSVGVVDGEAYPIIEIAPITGFYDYKNKYQAGAAIETCPAEIPAETAEKMQEAAVKGYQALSLESYARLDFMMNEKGEFFCLEANTLPGMTPTSLLPQEAGALGMDFPALCERLIQVSLKKYE
ncbi:D-alanine--D-alanine ligase [Lactonifactor longoviformis]|uniref:D-alanine--D-alanine ligase family protein n=1 Tax=Lactonifactor longoviformis TaxID=341220 RepID=UPI0036F29289